MADPASPSREIGSFLPALKQAGCEACHSYPFNVDVRNQCSSTYIPTYAFMVCAGTNLPVVVGDGGDVVKV